MPKMNIKVTLITPEKAITNTYKAIFHQETQEIIYQEEDKTKAIFDFKGLRLRRKNDNLCMEYTFNPTKKTEGIIKINDLNQEVLININTKKIRQENKKIEIEYQLEEDNYKYKLEVIE